MPSWENDIRVDWWLPGIYTMAHVNLRLPYIVLDASLNLGALYLAASSRNPDMKSKFSLSARSH